MSPLLTDCFWVAAPPQAPVIDGVVTGISVTNEGLSEVGLLARRVGAGLALCAETLPGSDCGTGVHKTWS